MKIWIDDFLHYLQAQRGCSPRTIETYFTTLNDCANHFLVTNPQAQWCDITTQHVRQWVSAMMERGFSPNTVKKSLSSLRSFYKFLLRENRVKVDPARLVHNPKTPKRIPTFIRESEMDRLFEYYPFTPDYIGQRDRTILLLLYHTGVRSAELLGLDIGDIEFGNQQLRVTGKGNKQRIIPFGKELFAALRHYLNCRNANFAQKRLDEPQALFLTIRGKRLSYMELHKAVHDSLSAVTTQKKKSPHILRHSFATAMLAHGAQLEAIQQLLGHESVVTTAIYTHATAEELRTQYAKAHPHSENERTD